MTQKRLLHFRQRVILTPSHRESFLPVGCLNSGIIMLNLVLPNSNSDSSPDLVLYQSKCIPEVVSTPIFYGYKKMSILKGNDPSRKQQWYLNE